MDKKETLINEIKLGLYNDLTTEQIQKVEEVLYIKMSKYEITERSTEIIPSHNSPIQILQRFAVDKSTGGLSPLSVKRYYQQNEKMLYAINKPIDEITTYDVKSYLTTCKVQRNISFSTLDGMRLCISSFFSWCASEKIIPENPCIAIKPIKHEDIVKKPFSQADMEKIKCACTTKRDKALVEFLYSTGCRVSEVSKLDRDEIDFREKSVIVNGKGNKKRTVYINEVAMMYLEEYLESRTDSYPALFIGKGSNRLTKDGIEHALKRIGRRAGVEDVHPHRYRHTLATNMLDRGASIQDVQTILGHSDIKTTRIYCYIDQNNVKNSYRRYIS